MAASAQVAEQGVEGSAAERAQEDVVLNPIDPIGDDDERNDAFGQPVDPLGSPGNQDLSQPNLGDSAFDTGVGDLERDQEIGTFDVDPIGEVDPLEDIGTVGDSNRIGEVDPLGDGTDTLEAQQEDATELETFAD